MRVKLYTHKHYYFGVDVPDDEITKEVLEFLEENALKNRNQDVSYAKHHVPLSDEAMEKVIIAGPEEIIIQKTIRAKTDSMIDEILTEVQKRRFNYLLNGYSFAQIARIEECTIQSVIESINSANKKIRRYLNDNIDNL